MPSSSIIIIADSVLRDCEEPNESRLMVYCGATVKNITRIIRREHINFNETKLCILHLGTNDVANREQEVVVSRMSELVHQIVRKRPDIQVVISAILPRPRDYARTKPAIRLVNRELATWCSQKRNLHFNNTFKGYQQCSRPNTNLFAIDGVHLSWMGSIKATLILKNLIALWRQKRLSFKPDESHFEEPEEESDED
jgi:hypothetical protein